VKAVELIGQARSRDGTVLKLVRRGDEYIILANGKSLMSRWAPFVFVAAQFLKSHAWTRLQKTAFKPR
jgi:hypothetical protein